MNTTRTDPDLIASIANGENHDAWREFEAWYAPIVRSFCISRGMPRQDADDIAQEVFLRLSQSSIATRYDPQRGRFRSYLFQVTRSAVSSSSRQHPQWKSIDFSESPSCVNEWNKAWKSECIRRALLHVERTSSTSAKQILNLSMRGQNPAEISDALGVSVESVYKSRQRIRERIESTIRRFHIEE